MKKLLAITITVGLLSTQCVFAMLNGSDDFNDNSLDLTKWSPHTPFGVVELQEASQVIQFQKTTSDGNGFVGMNWIQFQMLYDYNWSVAIDVNLPTGLIDTGVLEEQDIFLSIFANNQSDPNDYISFGFEECFEDDGGWESCRGFCGFKATDGVTNDDDELMVNVATTYASLQLSWNAVNSVFSFNYDSDGGQNSYISLGSITISDWGMGNGDIFDIGIGASAENVGFAWNDNVYADNFNAQSAVPEPGVMLLFSVFLYPLLKLTRKRN